MKMRVKLSPGAKMPTRAHADDSGLDLYALHDVWLDAGSVKRIETGVAIEIPKGYEGQVRPKSGLASQSIYVLLGTIDNSFRGPIEVILSNLSNWHHQIKEGDKIGQLVITPVALPELELADELSETERGGSGFGSSGGR